jgi:hypothetical protein
MGQFTISNSGQKEPVGQEMYWYMIFELVKSLPLFENSTETEPSAWGGAMQITLVLARKIARTTLEPNLQDMSELLRNFDPDINTGLPPATKPKKGERAVTSGSEYAKKATFDFETSWPFNEISIAMLPRIPGGVSHTIDSEDLHLPGEAAWPKKQEYAPAESAFPITVTEDPLALGPKVGIILRTWRGLWYKYCKFDVV